MEGMRFMKEAAEAEGAGWPNPTPEQMAELGVDWNIFPNMVLVFSLDSTLVFRAVPDGDSPDHCIFDMWGLLRVAPDSPPEFEYEFYDNWRGHEDKIPFLLVQDLENIERVHRGMKSMAFSASRANPIQEKQITNHHRTLRQYLEAE